LRPDYAASAAKARLMAFKKKIIEFFSPFLGKSQSASPGNLIAAYTVARCNDLDSRLRVQRLVPTDGADGETRNHGPQESIVANLFEAIAYDTGDTRFRTFVLTGEAGVGKSTALRAISRKLAIAFQDGSVPLDLLPITLPLQQVTVPADSFASSSTEAAGRLLRHLLEYWCIWVSGLAAENQITIEWLQDWLREHPSVLILDGLDEFFINNVGIDSEMIGAMLSRYGRTLQDRPNAIRTHTAVLAIRDSYPGHTHFATRTTYVFLIEKLTSAQAISIYPDMRDVLHRLRGTSTLSVLLTPLILSWLGPRGKELKAESLENKSVVMRHALNAIIDESHVGAALNSSFGIINLSNALIMLSIIGWLFFRDNKGIMSLDEIQTESQVLADEWMSQASDLNKADEIMRAFQLLANEDAIRVLMERTVFVSTGAVHWRFAHREWQDFLTASYMANAYYHWNFVEMGHRAMTQAIFKLIGEILVTLPEKFEITATFTENIFRAGGLAAVNLAGVVGNGLFVVHSGAIRRFFSIETLDQMNKTARLIFFTGCMYRALRHDPRDPSAADLRRAVIAVCRTYGVKQDNPHRDALTTSLAWCYHAAIAASDNRIERPITDWPGLAFEREHEEPVLSMLTAGPEHQFRIEPHHRSLQVAWLQILPIVLENPHRPVSIAHYLYTMVVVYRHGVHIPEISDELPAILSDNSKYAEIFRGYTAVPELWTIFTSCQAAYRAAATSFTGDLTNRFP